MQQHDIYRDITERTGGDIYIGVVGPVRTGKSTFIKRFMELLVIPNIEDFYEKERAKDELPQSGSGRTIMTTEPKFIPGEAVGVEVRDGIKMNVRLVDCVGYTVDGALGYMEEDVPRMVTTPWFDEPVPFQEAAELGTRKVITDHSTLGIVVVTDGSVTDIPRENYLEAEERVINELKELNKPFIIVLNSSHPYEPETMTLAQSLQERHDVAVVPVNAAAMDESDLNRILEEVLFEFPVMEVNVRLPRWVEELDSEHWLRSQYEGAVRDAVSKVRRLRDIDSATAELAQSENVKDVVLENMELGTGVASIGVFAPDDLIFRILSEIAGEPVEGDHSIVRLMRDFSYGKRQYDKMAEAFEDVKANGYGIIKPHLEDLYLAEPELIKQGRSFGVKLAASAPTYHLIRANVTTEITPIIGTEKQCEDLVRYILDEFQESPQKIWETNIFGKSLYELVEEGIQGKIYQMPENAQTKLQETLQRIVNDGGGGLICIIL